MEYTAPQIRDYGTLLELTADIDAHFFGTVSNLVVAALSAPLGGDVGGRSTSGGVSDLDSGGAADVLSTARGGGGQLPFAGFPALLLAGAGAALLILGAALRSIFRPRDRT